MIQSIFRRQRSGEVYEKFDFRYYSRVIKPSKMLKHKSYGITRDMSTPPRSFNSPKCSVSIQRLHAIHIIFRSESDSQIYSPHRKRRGSEDDIVFVSNSKRDCKQSIEVTERAVRENPHLVQSLSVIPFEEIILAWNFDRFWTKRNGKHIFLIWISENRPKPIKAVGYADSPLGNCNCQRLSSSTTHIIQRSR